MSGITLVFTICSVIVAGAHFALVNGEAAPDRLVKPHTPNHGLPGSWGNCYSCDHCDAASSMKNVSCPFYRESLPGCVTFTTTDLRDFNNEYPRVFRGCVNDQGTCEKIKQTVGVNILSCTECFSDLCNYD